MDGLTYGILAYCVISVGDWIFRKAGKKDEKEFHDELHRSVEMECENCGMTFSVRESYSAAFSCPKCRGNVRRKKDENMTGERSESEKG